MCSDLIEHMNAITTKNDEAVRNGVDRWEVVTEDDSAFIKSFFDTYPPETTEEGQVISLAFSCESNEWYEEIRLGLR